MWEKTFDWWCEACEKGCDHADEDGNELLPIDREGYTLCPTCDSRVIGFDERND